MTIPQLPSGVERSYYTKISKIESGDNPKAKAKTSSASGRFQFIKSTWEGLGYNWADVFDDRKQWQAIEKFTAQNAAALIKGGCAINHATLYGAHFLGVAGLLKVMRGGPDAHISTVTTAAQRKANPTILKGTVRDFTNWLERKTGDDYRKRYSLSDPDIPVVPLPPPTTTNEELGIIGLSLVICIIVFAVVIFVISRS